MKPEKARGIKGRIVVTLDGEHDQEDVTLYRGGKTGLAFRSPAHRVLKQSAQQLRGAEAAKHRTLASAAGSYSQGGSQ
jgi:hypothetical protein